MERKQRRLLMVLAMGLVVGMAASAANAQVTGWWKFDETFGTTAYDEMGTWNGWFDWTGTPPEWQDDPERGRVVYFTGGTGRNESNGNGVLNFGNDPIFNLRNGASTVSLWMRIPTWLRSWDYFISRYDGNNWRAGRSGTSDSIRWTTGETGLYTGPMADNNWHHLCWTYDGAEYILYLDGEVEDSAFGAPPVAATGSSRELILGGRRGSNQARFWADEFFISAYKAITAADVMDLYMGRKTPIQINFPPVVEAGAGYLCVIQPTVGDITMELSGTAEDTTIFGPNALNFGWSKIMGAGTVTYDPEPNVFDVTATFSDVGRYILKFSANDGVYEANDTVIVDVKPWYFTGL
ncbi:LamG domain-containing protein, partial [Planctomycetota bacterium]